MAHLPCSKVQEKFHRIIACYGSSRCCGAMGKICKQIQSSVSLAIGYTNHTISIANLLDIQHLSVTVMPNHGVKSTKRIFMGVNTL